MNVDFYAVRQLAWSIIKKYNLEIPIDLDYLLKELDVDLERTQLPERVDGASLPVKFAKGLIVVNEGRGFTRERFTIAHELGHILRHFPRMEQEGGLFFSDKKNPVLASLYEREADVFATELLMPRQEVINAFRKYSENIQELANMFLVSKQAMKIRLEELKLIPRT